MIRAEGPLSWDVMRGLTHEWRSRRTDQRRPDDEAALARTLGVEPVVARVLWARGQFDPVAARAFLEPALSNLSDPSALTGMDRAAARLLEAARSGEPVAIYGDYDVDGVTATAMLMRMLRATAPGADVRSYVPDRLTEGYGMHPAAVRELAEGGARVIVSVDCGITAIEPATIARRLGVDLIITDHHNPRPDGALPAAFAIVHPRIGEASATAPFAQLSGAGVAFLLAWRIASLATGGGRVDSEMQRLLLDLLALAALGTVADMVPLTGDNRIIARYGLARMRSTSILGLSALISESGLVDADVDAEAAGFRLGPRLNACGRMGHARDAIELFTTDDMDRARDIALRLGALNRDRQRAEREIVDGACEMAQARGMTGAGARVIVLASPAWHRGIVGIGCSRLVAQFRRPVVLMNVSEGMCRGSARSIKGYNLHAALEACAEHLETFGGHDMAAGLALQADRLDAFTESLSAHANEHITDAMMTPTVTVDCEATPDELTHEAVHQLMRLGPFGQGNPKPRLLLAGVRCTGARLMGANGSHVSLALHCGATQRQLRIVGWHWGERFEQLTRACDGSADLVITPGLNTFRGVTSVQGELQDIAAPAPVGV